MMIPVGSGPLAGQIAAAAAEQMNTKMTAETGTNALAAREVPKALVRAIRAELRALLDGNLEDNLTQVEQVAVRARELFMSIRGPGAQFIRGGPQTSVTGAIVNGLTSYNGATATVYPQSYSNPEQFGASAIRQLVNLVPEILSAQSSTPDKLMAAIALAEEKGHHDIAKSLKKKLMGSDYSDESKQLVLPDDANSIGGPGPTERERRGHERHETHEAHEVHEINGTSTTKVAVVGNAVMEAAVLP
jgi:hypothetical protein